MERLHAAPFDQIPSLFQQNLRDVVLFVYIGKFFRLWLKNRLSKQFLLSQFSQSLIYLTHCLNLLPAAKLSSPKRITNVVLRDQKNCSNGLRNFVTVKPGALPSPAGLLSITDASQEVAASIRGYWLGVSFVGMHMELAEWLVHWAPKLASRVQCSTRSSP